MIQFIFKSGKVTKLTYGVYENVEPEKLEVIKNGLVEMLKENMQKKEGVIYVADKEKRDILLVRVENIDQVNVFFEYFD